MPLHWKVTCLNGALQQKRYKESNLFFKRSRVTLTRRDDSNLLSLVTYSLILFTGTLLFAAPTVPTLKAASTTAESSFLPSTPLNLHTLFS